MTTRQISIDEDDFQAFVDGQLPPDRRRAVMAYLAARPEESARMSDYRNLNQELHRLYDEVLYEPLPARLRIERYRSRTSWWRRPFGWFGLPELGLAPRFAGVAMLLGGNLIAAALGTTLGNPLTYPLILWADYEVGATIVGNKDHPLAAASHGVIRESLGQCHEQWNGKGGPRKLKGEEISLATRIFLVAHDADIYHRVGGVEAATSVVRQRTGRRPGHPQPYRPGQQSAGASRTRGECSSGRSIWRLFQADRPGVAGQPVCPGRCAAERPAHG